MAIYFTTLFAFNFVNMQSECGCKSDQPKQASFIPSVNSSLAYVNKQQQSITYTES